MATAWVLLLVTVVLGLARAGPVPTSKPTTTRRGCHIGRFQSLSPWELEAFKKAKDALEESLSLKNWNCSSRLFPRTRDPRHLQAWKRPVALEAEVGLTVKVLGTSADSPLGVVLGQPLHMLRHIHSELQACVPAQPTPRSKAAGSPPPLAARAPGSPEEGVPGPPRGLCHVQHLPPPHSGPNMRCQWRPAPLVAGTHPNPAHLGATLFMRPAPPLS